MAFTPLVQYKGKNDDRGPSPIIWADLPRDIQDPNVGYEFFDDFLDFGVKTLPTTVGHASGGYDGFGSASNTIADAGVRGGAITLAPTVGHRQLVLRYKELNHGIYTACTVQGFE